TIYLDYQAHRKGLNRLCPMPPLFWPPSFSRTHKQVTAMTAQYHKEGEWWVSPFNVKPEVTAEFDLPARVEIHDATLRDGEQTPGVVMSPEDKVAIAEMMSDVGVDRIEAG